MNNKIYCSFNENWINKCITRSKKELYEGVCEANDISEGDYGKPLGTLDGVNYSKVNMGYGWVNVEVDLDTVFNVVANEGFSISGQVSEGHRHTSTFIQSNIAMVDIDDNRELDTIRENEFYSDFGSGWYTSPSHTPHFPRFRIVFILERALTKEMELRAVYTSLIKIFGGDRACKDGARLFYGSYDAEYEIVKDKFIPNDVIDILISKGTEKPAVVNLENYEEPSDKMKAYVVRKLSDTYLGEYHKWLTIGCALKRGGFTLQDFQQATLNGMMNQKDAKSCEVLWRGISTNTNRAKVATMGSVWNVIGGMKQYYEEHPEDRKEKRLDNILQEIIKTTKVK